MPFSISINNLKKLQIDLHQFALLNLFKLDTMRTFQKKIIFSLIALLFSTIISSQGSGNTPSNPPVYSSKMPYQIFAETVIPVSASIPIYSLVKGLIKNDRESLIIGYQYTSTLIINEVITDVIKHSVYSGYGINSGFLTNPPGNQTIVSIPARHGTTAFATAANIGIQNPKWYIVIPSYLWASAVVYSRGELGEKYVTNLAGSFVVGVGSAYLSKFLIKQLFSRKKKEKIMNNYLLLK